jgi:hypothetical protein
LTSDASGPFPSDAGTGRQKVEAIGGRSSSASKRGKASGGWTPTPERAFGQLEYPTPPLHVSDDFMNTALSKALAPAFAEPDEEGT